MPDSNYTYSAPWLISGKHLVQITFTIVGTFYQGIPISKRNDMYACKFNITCLEQSARLNIFPRTDLVLLKISSKISTYLGVKQERMRKKAGKQN